jgi:phage portal protein BeeE
MSAFVFKEALMLHLLTWGNAYAEIERDASGRVRALAKKCADAFRMTEAGADA